MAVWNSARRARLPPQPRRRGEVIPIRLHLRYRNLPIWALALAAAVLISGCGFLVDHIIHNAQSLRASDFYTAVIAFIFSYALLSYEAHRRAVLSRRMEIVAEVNHHIRNALTGVVFTAAAKEDPALEAVVKDATERIDWVLTTVLPDGAADLQWPVQASSWSPSAWQGTAKKS